MGEDSKARTQPDSSLLLNPRVLDHWANLTCMTVWLTLIIFILLNENRTSKMKFFLVSRNFFSWTFISQMGVKMNLRIIITQTPITQFYSRNSTFGLMAYSRLRFVKLFKNHRINQFCHTIAQNHNWNPEIISCRKSEFGVKWLILGHFRSNF